jgi:hypothetical protein
VNIHFARADVRRLRILIDIEEKDKEKRRIIAKSKKGDHLGKYKKRKDKIEKEIKEKYEEYEKL